MIKITVAIPYCQEEKSVFFTALQSALDQNFDDMEILVVDDSFSYKAQKLCQKYIKEFKRINKSNKKIKSLRYISHSVNRGCLVTRITSAYNAKGEYITFLDTDDRFYSNDALQIMYTNGEGYDLLLAGTQVYHPDAKQLEFALQKLNFVTNPEVLDIPNEKDNLFDVFYSVEQKVSGFVWGKLYRTEVLQRTVEQIPMLRCTLWEDFLLNYFVACNFKTFKSIPDKCYFYNLCNGVTGYRLIDTLDQWITKISVSEVFTTILYDMEKRPFVTEDFKNFIRRQFFIKTGEIAILLQTSVDKSIYPQALDMFYEYFGEENAKAALKAVEPKVERVIPGLTRNPPHRHSGPDPESLCKRDPETSSG